MIRKLKIRFIVLAMLALFFLLALVVTGMNIINYTSLVADADSKLDLLSQNRGSFPEFDELPPPHAAPFITKETPYETRYFTLLINNDGEIIQKDISRIKAVDEETAAAYAAMVAEQDSERGFMEEYRYLRNSEGRSVRITFLDFGREFYSCREFLRSSIYMSVFGYTVSFFVILFFSGRILRPVAESYEKQKRFITDAGHEIKTPLAIIKADADVLEMEYGESEWLDGIQLQVRRLSALTSDLVYLSRMEEAEKTLPMIEFPFSDVVSETAASFHGLAQMQQKDLRWEVPPMISYTGNEKGIRQLVNILLDNALKYSPEKSLIGLTVKKQHRQLVLTVSNETLQPVSRENMEQLFERFYRMDSSRGADVRGYGIGLSVAKAIVSSHGGRIRASSADGHSLTLTAQFPL